MVVPGLEHRLLVLSSKHLHISYFQFFLKLGSLLATQEKLNGLPFQQVVLLKIKQV